MQRSITIRGARTHNLKNISLELPRGKLTVVTGVSGSGKSSLVFDTLYAEGQRRYVQSLSTYARLFLERMDRPDVDTISEIPPALALRQKNSIRNARSTVGTVTEINDYLRLLFATVGESFCPQCGQRIKRDTVDDAAAAVHGAPGLYLFLAAYPRGSRSLAEALGFLVQNGYHRLFSGEKIIETALVHDRITAPSQADAGVDEPLMVVIDRVSVTADGCADSSASSDERVREALEKAFHFGAGRARAVRVERDNGSLNTLAVLDFDRGFNCARCGIVMPEPTPALFSSNSPIGACPTCEGFGRTIELDLDKVIPNPNLSLRQGMVAPWRTPAYKEMAEWMLACAQRKRIRTTAPYHDLTAEERTWLLDGEPDGSTKSEHHRWPGIRGFFKWLEGRRYKTHVRILLARYRRFVPCPTCSGSKLRPEALNVKIAGCSIADVARKSVDELAQWVNSIAQTPSALGRAATVVRELRSRIGYLVEVGLGYLTLDRQARTLSGGEAQRIHLASALGSLLTGTLYALDEPTVGLHARDSRRLLGVLHHLRDLGNTVVVVEHDPVMIGGGDYLVELGPGGGRDGGELIAAGAPDSDKQPGITPGRVLLMRALARERRFSRRDPALRITSAAEHNLHDLDVTIPLGRFVCVTGVSGSGKSTLVEDVLYNNYLRRSGAAVEAGACGRIDGLDQVGAIVHMGQEQLSRSARSNPATYLKIYDDIRKLFAATPEARRLGIKASHFSFNVAGGRCEKCHGTGTLTIEMHFMADVEVTCDNCDGRRFQSHILRLKLLGRDINQVLALTIDEGRALFARQPKITRRLDALSSVGLGYLQLGQPTSTLSGGEAQRLRLARFLMGDLEPVQTDSRGVPLPRIFILDEPTTGLSSSDIRSLLRVLNKLVTEGNTLIVIEHNLELIAHADYIIDLGPEGGDQGGELVVAGSPMVVAAHPRSHTGRELRRMFGLPQDAPAATIRSAARAITEA